MLNNIFQKIILALVTLACAQSYACDEAICVGDTVYRGSLYKEGGVVVFIDRAQSLAYLRVLDNNHPREIIVPEKFENLDLTTGCIDQVCTGQLISLKLSPDQTMLVIGINPYTRAVLIKGENYLFEHELSELVKI